MGVRTMSNKYCNLSGADIISETFGQINDGFTSVETDIDDTKEAIEKIDQRVDGLVNNPDPNKDLELVDLRNSYIYGVFPTAKARLDYTDNLFSSQLAENATNISNLQTEGKLTMLKFAGYSIQSSTPTPSSPVDIESSEIGRVDIKEGATVKQSFNTSDKLSKSHMLKGKLVLYGCDITPKTYQQPNQPTASKGFYWYNTADGTGYYCADGVSWTPKSIYRDSELKTWLRDEYDALTGILTRRCKSITPTSKSVGRPGTANYVGIFADNDAAYNVDATAAAGLLCSHCVSKKYNDLGASGISGVAISSNYVCISIDGCTTSTQLNEWLAANKPEIVYPLETEISQYIGVLSPNDIITKYDDTTVEIDSDASLEYTESQISDADRREISRKANAEYDFSDYGLAYIRNNRLVANFNNGHTAVYSDVDVGSAPTKMSCKCFFTEEESWETAALIANVNGLGKVSNILQKSLHAVFHSGGVKVELLDNSSSTELYSETYPTPLKTDVEYTFGWELDGTDLIITTATGVHTVDVSGHTMSAYIGQYCTLEHYSTGTAKLPQFTEFIVANGSGIMCYDNFRRPNGVIGIAPSGHIYHQYSIKAGWRITTP